MKPTEKIARRSALLEGVELSQSYLDAIASEIEDLDRIVTELEEFAQGTPWVSQQSQPGGSKA
ncbi:MAG TPA: hypothetical protein VMR88_14505 [Candidatus Polarisedimenticolaceae bacterium]|nr:hypothetical protein [Candidatus Polarisedimenticolaceae bacterium]